MENKIIPLRLKPSADFAALPARLKPCPFKAASSSAALSKQQVDKTFQRVVKAAPIQSRVSGNQF
jgi:hypothetical protein